MPRRRLTEDQEEQLVAEWLEWRKSRVGLAEDIWGRYGISKESGYNILRRHGAMPHRGELGPVPQEVVRMALEAMKQTNDDLRARVTHLEEENEKLRKQIARK